jgi:hypothetical protein
MVPIGPASARTTNKITLGALALLLPVFAIACGSPSNTHASPASVSMSSAATTTRSAGGTGTYSNPSPGCPEVTGQVRARQGVISAGPFSQMNLSQRDPSSGSTEHKIWVASQRLGRDEAVLLLDPPGSSQPQTYRREPGQATVPDAAQFFPGLVNIFVPGQWRFRITVGHDVTCFTVNFSG